MSDDLLREVLLYEVSEIRRLVFAVALMVICGFTGALILLTHILAELKKLTEKGSPDAD
jgi:hypothetical protein